MKDTQLVAFTGIRHETEGWTCIRQKLKGKTQALHGIKIISCNPSLRIIIQILCSQPNQIHRTFAC